MLQMRNRRWWMSCRFRIIEANRFCAPALTVWRRNLLLMWSKVLTVLRGWPGVAVNARNAERKYSAQQHQYSHQRSLASLWATSKQLAAAMQRKQTKRTRRQATTLGVKPDSPVQCAGGSQLIALSTRVMPQQRHQLKQQSRRENSKTALRKTTATKPVTTASATTELRSVVKTHEAKPVYRPATVR